MSGGEAHRMTATPTNRLTRAWLTERGYIVALAERFDARLRRRIDLFGFIDYVAVRDGEIVGVQCTSDRNRSSRRQKILAEPNAATWARGGGRILLITWGKHGPRGGRKKWEAHVEWLQPELRG